MRQAKNQRRARRRGILYGVRVPQALSAAIEDERDNLARAESLLACLIVSLAHDEGDGDRPYYPDVAQLARELVRRSINRLDSLEIQKLLRGHRVEDLAASGTIPYVAAVVQPAGAAPNGLGCRRWQRYPARGGRSDRPARPAWSDFDPRLSPLRPPTVRCAPQGW
jgi:hypothetical protein